jgi:hypothetical protein
MDFFGNEKMKCAKARQKIEEEKGAHQEWGREAVVRIRRVLPTAFIPHLTLEEHFR